MPSGLNASSISEIEQKDSCLFKSQFATQLAFNIVTNSEFIRNTVKIEVTLQLQVTAHRSSCKYLYSPFMGILTQAQQNGVIKATQL